MTTLNVFNEMPRQIAMLTDVSQQMPYTTEVVSIRNLIRDQELYSNYPEMQRGFIWISKFKQELIDSILRGFPIDALSAYKSCDDTGHTKYFITDGHQRLSTVYAFAKGEFATATCAQSKKYGAFEPMEPGRHFSEMSMQAQEAFKDYRFTINISPLIDEDVMGLQFRRKQNQAPLAQAEKLASYRSLAIDCARLLQDHPIWRNIYLGKDARKQTLQGSLTLIALELYQGYANLASGVIHSLAAGSKDAQISQSLYDAIENHLEILMYVFDGITFTHRAEIIPMYQAIVFLENRGHEFTSSDKGLLTSWFSEVLHGASVARGGFNYPLARMIELRQQHAFWNIHLPRIAEICKASRHAA
jgi:Protein of unknown function DUF262